MEAIYKDTNNYFELRSLTSITTPEEVKIRKLNSTSAEHQKTRRHFAPMNMLARQEEEIEFIVGR